MRQSPQLQVVLTGSFIQTQCVELLFLNFNRSRQDDGRAATDPIFMILRKQIRYNGSKL